LTPGRHGVLDQWWRLRAGEDSTPIGNEILHAIADYGLPELRARADAVGGQS